jgi:hypothetical protein
VVQSHNQCFFRRKYTHTHTIKIDETKTNKEQSSQSFPIEEIKNYYQRKYLQEKEDQIKIRVLEYMKKQLFSSFPSKAASNEDRMSTSSLGSKYYFEEDIVGESQPEEEPMLEEFWDSLKAHVAK